jgi:hypothetical protein
MSHEEEGFDHRPSQGLSVYMKRVVTNLFFIQILLPWHLLEPTAAIQSLEPIGAMFHLKKMPETNFLSVTAIRIDAMTHRHLHLRRLLLLLLRSPCPMASASEGLLRRQPRRGNLNVLTVNDEDSGMLHPSRSLLRRTDLLLLFRLTFWYVCSLN